jgi:hypothetical protein
MLSTQRTGVLEANAGTSRPVDAVADTSAVAAFVRFGLHFLEMVVAMAVGMAIFAPFKAALVDQGDTSLLDRTSFEYQAWMNLFMVVPMILWMRVRGHAWHHGIEMGAAMVGPVAFVLIACSLGIERTFPWFTTSLAGMAMFLGMLGYMLYRRDMYVHGYSLAWLRRRGRTQT